MYTFLVFCRHLQQLACLGLLFDDLINPSRDFQYSRRSSNTLAAFGFSLQVFLKSAMSVLERAFESNQDEVIGILKNLQVRLRC